jgi:hypothetical protein
MTTPVFDLNPDDIVVRELLAPYARVQPVTLRRRRPTRGWKRRFALAVVAVGVTGMIAAVAVAGTGWLVGSPAPASVQSDFESYAAQLGEKPVPGRAVLVASSGDFQLYATLNDKGGVCTLVSAPWNRPESHEGGNCSTNTPDATPFWAGINGMDMGNNGSTVVVDGHSTAEGAASVQFESPNGETVNAPVNASGFFIAGMTVPGSMCDWGAWTPTFTVLDSNGQQLSTESISLLPGASKVTSDRGPVCVVQANGPIGSSVGQLNPGG